MIIILYFCTKKEQIKTKIMKNYIFSSAFISLLMMFYLPFTHAQNLNKTTAEKVRNETIDQWKKGLSDKLKSTNETSCIIQGNLKMKYTAQIFGEKPADGRSLWISMHGGGNAPTALNDSQWENQKRLYRPQGAVYLSPRAITNTWDLHFRPEDDTFYRQIIMMMQVSRSILPPICSSTDAITMSVPTAFSQKLCMVM